MGTDPILKFTLGIHPHMLKDNLATFFFNQLKNKLEEFPEALGIGEVGLDLTTSCRCRQTHDADLCKTRKIKAQRQFLRLIFQLTKQYDKVLILHCRDEGTGQAAKEVLALLQEYDPFVMPEFIAIVLVCGSGGG